MDETRTWPTHTWRRALENTHTHIRLITVQFLSNDPFFPLGLLSHHLALSLSLSLSFKSNIISVRVRAYKLLMFTLKTHTESSMRIEFTVVTDVNVNLTQEQISGLQQTIFLHHQNCRLQPRPFSSSSSSSSSHIDCMRKMWGLPLIHCSRGRLLHTLNNPHISFCC